MVQKAINKLPKFLLNILTGFRIRVYVTNVFQMTGIRCLGCYYVTESENEKKEISILIDKKTCLNAKYIFYHEVGHFLDELLGCYKAKVPFIEKNRSIYRFSRTDSTFHHANLHEKYYFIQTERSNEKNDMFYYDMMESFADCFAEIMMNKRCFKMNTTKNHISAEIKKNFSQFETENSCKILHNVLQYI